MAVGDDVDADPVAVGDDDVDADPVAVGDDDVDADVESDAAVQVHPCLAASAGVGVGAGAATVTVAEVASVGLMVLRGTHS